MACVAVSTRCATCALKRPYDVRHSVLDSSDSKTGVSACSPRFAVFTFWMTVVRRFCCVCHAFHSEFDNEHWFISRFSHSFSYFSRFPSTPTLTAAKCSLQAQHYRIHHGRRLHINRLLGLSTLSGGLADLSCRHNLRSVSWRCLLRMAKYSSKGHDTRRQFELVFGVS